MSTSEELRDRLQGLRVFGGELPTFDTDAAPPAPLPLLLEWFHFALDAGVSQPHAAGLATVSADGTPSNRTLLIKDIYDNAVWFASLSSGPKGHDLVQNPKAALLLYWREQGRQVRIVGQVAPGPRETSEGDFLQRHPNARAMAIAGDQSEPVPTADAPSSLDERLAAARARIESDPEFVPESWTAYRLVPTEVEFWQAERKRDQVRLRYRQAGDGWIRDILWP